MLPALRVFKVDMMVTQRASVPSEDYHKVQAWLRWHSLVSPGTDPIIVLPFERRAWLPERRKVHT